MIEFKIAKDGTRIFSWQGKLICSGTRPGDEAKKWVERHSNQIRKCKSIIVLGLANGFHVAELAKKFPGIRVCVINDNDKFLVPSTQVLDIQSSLFEVITVQSVEDLKYATKIRKILNMPYAVIKFAPAVALNQKFYTQVGELLLGRTQEALRFCLACRGDDWAGVNVNGIKESYQKQGLQLISFKNLQESLFKSKSAHRTKIMGRVLSELIR